MYSIHLSVDRHLGCLHLLVLVNIADESLSKLILGLYPEVELLTHMVIQC